MRAKFYYFDEEDEMTSAGKMILSPEDVCSCVSEINDITYDPELNILTLLAQGYTYEADINNGEVNMPVVLDKDVIGYTSTTITVGQIMQSMASEGYYDFGTCCLRLI